MFVWLLIAVALTLLFVLLGRALAGRKGRNRFRWGLAAAILPPLLLVLLALPRIDAGPTPRAERA
ncbi:MAG: hypothetical protein MI920_09075 [Kiloniellales bacterium]|nr:hypothetical protein [Kiloniellales bacterium]